MLLISKILLSDFLSYNKDYIECLNHNVNNNYISEIFVFIDDIDKQLPKHKKIKYFKSKNLTDLDIIEYSKRQSNQNKIIWTFNTLIGFNEDLNKIKNQKSIFRTKDYFMFNNNSIINNSFKIEENYRDPNLEIRHFNRKIINSYNFNNEVIRKKGNIIKSDSKVLNRDLEIIIISVNYNDYLLITLTENTKNFDNINVVTSTEDLMCQKICEKFGVNCIVTDIMYENEDTFNKGRAINYAINKLKNPGFILLLDADIIIKDEIDIDGLDFDTLYTSDRWICKDYNTLNGSQNDINQIKNKCQFENNKGLGFFQLFHYSKECSFPESSGNAAFSDLLFRDKFTKREKIKNDIIHLGYPYKNWDGRITERFINDDTFSKMFDNIKNKNKINFKNIFEILDYLPYKTDSIDYLKNNLSMDDDPYIIHVTSKYYTNDKETIRRNDFAESTWKTIYEKDKVIPAYLYQKDKNLPLIKDFFDHGYNLCEKDNDIILYTNSDICLTDDTYEKIVESCKKWNCTFSFRKDLFYKLKSIISKEEVENALYSGGIKTPHGADLFAVTKKWWRENKYLIPDNQYIGRPTWDWIFRIAMGISIKGSETLLEPFEEQGSICETPNINYHERHESYWEQKENLLDSESLNNVRIAYKWMSEMSPNNNYFTGKDYFDKTYDKLVK